MRDARHVVCPFPPPQISPKNLFSRPLSRSFRSFWYPLETMLDFAVLQVPLGWSSFQESLQLSPYSDLVICIIEMLFSKPLFMTTKISQPFYFKLAQKIAVQPHCFHHKIEMGRYEQLKECSKLMFHKTLKYATQISDKFVVR